MKIKELIQKTGVPKQTIHYYIQSGLLPKPRRLGPNSADYGQTHVERLGMIKQLQEDYYLPLAVIKKVLKKHNRGGRTQPLLRLKVDYCKPLDQLLAGDIKGEAAFLEATGLRLERLEEYEQWELITPTLAGGEKVYSYDDQVIGRIIAQYRDIGLTAELGFKPDMLKNTVETLRRLVDEAVDGFFVTAAESMNDEKINELSKLAGEITALFYYHVYNKLARVARLKALARVAGEQSGAVLPPP